MIPPLSMLEAFAAAAETGSFREAAERLHVTASAVSHRIKTLEDLLGVALFARTTRRVILTPAGEAYLLPVREALGSLAQATAALRQAAPRPRLTVSAAPSFAISWLMPRLPRFQVAHPEIEVRLEPSVGLADLWGSDIDVAIRHTGRPHFPGLTAHRLLGEPLTAVCTPDYAARHVQRPEDLPRARLIHCPHRFGQWRTWLAAAGLDAPACEDQPAISVEYDSVAVGAALDGLGVALVAEPFVRRELDEGRLVAPLGFAAETHQAYYLLHVPERTDDPPVAAFRDWLLAELPADEAAAIAPEPPGSPSASG